MQNQFPSFIGTVTRRRCRDYIGEILNASESVHGNYQILVASLCALQTLRKRFAKAFEFSRSFTPSCCLCCPCFFDFSRSTITDNRTYTLWPLEIPSGDKIAIGWWLIAFFVRAKIFGVCGDGGGRLARAACNSIGYFDDQEQRNGAARKVDKVLILEKTVTNTGRAR